MPELVISTTSIELPGRRIQASRVTGFTVERDRQSSILRVGAWVLGIAVTVAVLLLLATKGVPGSSRALAMMFAGPAILIWAARMKVAYVATVHLAEKSIEIVRTYDEAFQERMREVLSLFMENGPERELLRVDLGSE
jgi:alanine dehydrogenase